VRLPLPPPTRDDGGTKVGTRVRMSQELLDTTARDLPVLPPESVTEATPLPGVDSDDRTMVDPPMFGQPAPDQGALFADLGELESDDASVTDISEGGAVRLPLPAPSNESRVERMTQPGTRQRIVRKREQTPPSGTPTVPELDTSTGTRPVQPGQFEIPTPTPTLSVDDQATAVATDPLAPTRAPLVGGRYRIVQRIGEGGMGKVYKVTHAQLGKTFALKIISGAFASESKARDLFYREARLASSLSHPGITSVVDFGEDEQHGAFMVMECLEGLPLNKLLRKEGRLGLRQACDIMMQVAEALHYIHGNKIVHCDIKTENILVCEMPGSKRRQKQVKLLDFGLARSTTSVRQTGSLSGTPHYVAPERIRGEEPSPSSDIYGLGVLFYELTTGKVPWDGNVAQILCGHLELAPVPPSELIEGGLDDAVENLILRALAKDPVDRHKDMAAFIYELNTVIDMLGFGRRKRGSGRKIVIERTENKRDELARGVFDASRLPLALLNGSGLIVVANVAFAKFVMGVAVDVEGLNVQATPLAKAWGTFENDLAYAVSGHPVRRIVEVDVGPEEVKRLLIWLDPGFSEDHVIFGVHPLYA